MSIFLQRSKYRASNETKMFTFFITFYKVTNSSNSSPSNLQKNSEHWLDLIIMNLDHQKLRFDDDSLPFEGVVAIVPKILFICLSRQMGEKEAIPMTERGDSDEVEYFFRVYLHARRLIGRDEVEDVFESLGRVCRFPVASFHYIEIDDLSLAIEDRFGNSHIVGTLELHAHRLVVAGAAVFFSFW
jgi:hypothetical protein